MRTHFQTDPRGLIGLACLRLGCDWSRLFDGHVDLSSAVAEEPERAASQRNNTFMQRNVKVREWRTFVKEDNNVDAGNGESGEET